jgi:hypothetical protein
MEGVGEAEQFVLLTSWSDVWTLASNLYYTPMTEFLVFGSVLDANKGVWQGIVHALLGNNVTVLLGGYIDPSELNLSTAAVKVHWMKSLSDLAKWGGNVYAAPRHGMLKDYEALPRLTMSTGCLFRCSFCTIPQQVIELSVSAISQQVMSFKGLKFRYVYLDDKTFGQAENWKMLYLYSGMIRSFNPEFKGFIVQTTVNELLEHYDGFLDQGVVMAEIGVEVPDDAFLARMNKPYRRQALDKLMQFQEERRVDYQKPMLQIIPNLLFGVPGDNYEATLTWLRKNVSLISHVNFFILSFYEDAKNPEKLVGKYHGAGDDDENNTSRTWLTQAEVHNLEEAMAEAMSLVEWSWGL